MKAKYELFASTRKNKKSTEPCNAAKKLSPNTYTKLHGRKQKPKAHETITTDFLNIIQIPQINTKFSPAPRSAHEKQGRIAKGDRRKSMLFRNNH